MLNKKILVGGAGKEAPHVILTVGLRSSGIGAYGWDPLHSKPYGHISRIPVWGDVSLEKLYSYSASTAYSFSKDTKNRISIRRLDTGSEIEVYVNTNPTIVRMLFFTNADVDKKVPLMFTPPPTGYL